LRRHLDFRFRGRLPGVQIQAGQLRQYNNTFQLTTPKRVHATLKTLRTLIDIPMHFGPFFQRRTRTLFILFVSDLHLLYNFQFAVD